MPKQLSLLKDPRRETKLWWVVKQHNYGGSLRYRKRSRPFDSKKLTHVVFKAKIGGAIWFTRSQRHIENLLMKAAARYDVKVKDFAIHKDHIHVACYTKHPENQARFFRYFAAEMGRKYKEIRERFGVPVDKSIWVDRPFTRLVSWGKRSLRDLHNYLKKNRDEVMGFIEYQPRNHALTKFLKKWELANESG